MAGILKRREMAGLIAAGALGAVAGAAALCTRTAPRGSMPVVLGPASLLAASPARVFAQLGVAAVRVEGGIALVRMRCTHLGCTLRLVGEEFVCPCHGGRFGLHGQVKGGPPRASLAWLEGGVDAQGQLWCDPEREQRERTPVHV
jgi:cytochrome b6-f complex iron-sulfur subunit